MGEMGARLAQERTRLKLKQPAMAKHMGVVTRTYTKYEAGGEEISAGALARLAAIGVDILYIVTGKSAAHTLSDEEQMVLNGYRLLDARGRAGVLGMMSGLTAPESSARIQAEIGQYVKGDMNVKGPITIQMGKKKRR